MSLKGGNNILYILETVHIPLWLIKDLCWLMSFKLTGMLMAFPTICVAFLIVIMTFRDEKRFLPNLSIFFWILANANWMFAEFYDLQTRNLSLYPFIAGILVFLFFLIRNVLKSNKSDNLA